MRRRPSTPAVCGAGGREVEEKGGGAGRGRGEASDVESGIDSV